MMPLLSCPDFIKALPEKGALLGLDLGAKTIGVARSDQTRLIASAHRLLRRTQFTRDAQSLRAFACEEHCVGFVLGLPLNMDGSEGPRAQSTRSFARNFLKIHDIPILLWDERLSTRAVERLLIDTDQSRHRRGELSDKLAATWILQGFLDLMRSHP